MSRTDECAMEVVGSATEADERPGAAQEAREAHGARDARTLALVKLHEASAILLAAGDIAGVRAVHGAMGVLLGAVGGAESRTDARQAKADVAAPAARPVRRAG